jgi:hypothetical protein
MKNKDGLFIGPINPRNKGISGILIFELAPDNIHKAKYNLLPESICKVSN